jgi:hypothetical protein
VRLRSWATSGAEQVVPVAVARAMIARATKFDVEAGGRFDVRNDRTVVLWSADEHPDGGRGAPIASFGIRWRHPSTDQATVHRLAWDAEACSLLELHLAIDVLRGEA